MRDLFIKYRADENNPKWNNIISRNDKLYSRNDIRSEFDRDYTRIIHSQAYRRLKHKTQVFFSPRNDHICTRSEHVMHVESISYTIAKYFGLNVELTKAIATAHDIGHSPFGHQGEKYLSKISEQDLGKRFWHEKNGVEIVDKLELLDDPYGNKKNMTLTYAVRDGILSHCGEIDENCLKPRDEFIDLDKYTKPNEYAPYTWEGCVVKISDKIAYLGRDISDAITLGIIDESLDDLYKILGYEKDRIINNTVIINDLIYDLCNNSSLEKGLCFSNEMFEKLNKLKSYNYKKIYMSEKLLSSHEYFEVIINTIYNSLKDAYEDKSVIKRSCPRLIEDFEEWIKNYWNLEKNSYNQNKVIFDMNKKEDYMQAIIYYISGMTDNFIIEMYNDLIGFRN